MAPLAPSAADALFLALYTGAFAGFFFGGALERAYSAASAALYMGVLAGFFRVRLPGVVDLAVPIGWPLELLVTPACLKRYDALFGFLLLVKRVQGELHGAWASQTACAAFPAAQRALLLPLWQLRAQMAFVVDNLQYYLQVDVLAVQWEALEGTVPLLIMKIPSDQRD